MARAAPSPSEAAPQRKEQGKRDKKTVFWPWAPFLSTFLPFKNKAKNKNNQEKPHGKKTTHSGADSSKNPRQLEPYFNIKYLKLNCNLVKAYIKGRTCFSKGLKTTFISSCFFQIQSTWPYFVRSKKNYNSKTRCNSNIQQYTYIFCHWIQLTL